MAFDAYKIAPPEINITKSRQRGIRNNPRLLFLELEELPPLELTACIFDICWRYTAFLADICHAGLPVAKLEQLEFLLGDHPERDRHRGDGACLFGNDSRPHLRAVQGDVLDEFRAAELELLVKIEGHAMRGIPVDVGELHGEPHGIVQERGGHLDRHLFATYLAECGDDLDITHSRIVAQTGSPPVLTS